MNKDRQTWVILTPGFAANEADSTCIPMQQSFVRSIILNLILLFLPFNILIQKNNILFLAQQ
jgi:hypothetical protein